MSVTVETIAKAVRALTTCETALATSTLSFAPTHRLMSGPLRDLSNLGLSVRRAAGHSSDRGHAFAVVGATKAARKHEEKQKVKEEQEGRGGLERPTLYSQTQACRVGGDYDRIDPLLVVLCRPGRCCCDDEAVLPTTAAVDEVVPFEAGDDSEDEGDVEMVEVRKRAATT
eukprot:g13855.t1